MLFYINELNEFIKYKLNEFINNNFFIYILLIILIVILVLYFTYKYTNSYILNYIIFNYKYVYNKFFYSLSFKFKIISLSILFILLGYFLYNELIKDFLDKEHVLNKELSYTKKENNNLLVILFKTEWCPICITSKSEWDNFESKINTSNAYINYKVILSKIDCDDKPDIADKYNITAYPTVKLIYKEKIYTYDAAINSDNLIQFIDSVVN
jgi:thiol-disulfide isomerase/thioredoxin